MFITLLGSCGVLAMLSTSFQGNMLDVNHTRGAKPWVCLRYYPSQREYYATYLMLIARVRVVDISTRSSAGPLTYGPARSPKTDRFRQISDQKKPFWSAIAWDVQIRGQNSWEPFWSPDRKSEKGRKSASNLVPRTALLSPTLWQSGERLKSENIRKRPICLWHLRYSSVNLF